MTSSEMWFRQRTELGEGWRTVISRQSEGARREYSVYISMMKTQSVPMIKMFVITSGQILPAPVSWANFDDAFEAAKVAVNAHEDRISAFNAEKAEKEKRESLMQSRVW